MDSVNLSSKGYPVQTAVVRRKGLNLGGHFCAVHDETFGLGKLRLECRAFEV